MILNSCDFIFSFLPGELSPAVFSTVSKAVFFVGLIVLLVCFSSPLNHNTYLARLISLLFSLYFLAHMVYILATYHIMAPMRCPTYIVLNSELVLYKFIALTRIKTV